MAIDRLVGLQVINEAEYQAYREAMTPLLHACGGQFVVDVRVSEVLRSPTEGTFNRMFTIRFPDEAQMNAFFSDPAYVAIRERHFDPAVKETSILGKYGVEP